jgi:hypothetical protein
MVLGNLNCIRKYSLFHQIETGINNKACTPETSAMDLARFLPDRSTPVESKSHSQMKNIAKTTSPTFFKRRLQINNLQGSLMFRDARCQMSFIPRNLCPALTERFSGDTPLAAEGMFYSTFFSLLTVPAIFFLIQRFGF